ncbi:MAG: hypothetical protein J0H84_17105 [Rhizobiales bacterium]|nr:hypothetical protein [Hyphomicrobiales bacterium]
MKKDKEQSDPALVRIEVGRKAVDHFGWTTSAKIAASLKADGQESTPAKPFMLV